MLTWHPLLQMPAMRYYLGSVRATALACEGQLAAALAQLDSVTNGSGLKPAQLLTVRSGLHIDAGDIDGGIALRREAAAMSAEENLDLALGLLRYRRDVTGAREALASFPASVVTETHAAFLGWVDGLVALEERRWSDAATLLQAARGTVARALVASPTTALGVSASMAVARALALVELGDRQRAHAEVAPFLPLLERTDRTGILARYREALARPPACAPTPRP